jgi:NADH-quinone oxidoreductase subunit A
MLEKYAPILIFLIVAGAVSVVLLFLGFTFGRGRKDPNKLAPYECGFEAFEDTRIGTPLRNAPPPRTAVKSSFRVGS